ncbi:serine threonine- kinase HT1-like [Paramuricea clavata]|uniref:Serine threonine- kinase HT1-like n=1 Tax=Paramuricea clavata TaxID=317549 RepID=A0A7D9IIS4_PARCT|nr:serine threonine- kinase HT1-like [Paramuricea clavata]
MDTAATGNASLTKMSTASVKQIRPCELLPLEVNNSATIPVGSGTYGDCFLKTFKRFGITVVEKKLPTSDLKAVMNEAQCMNTLTHASIPYLLGVQIEEKPFSLVMQFVGDENLESVTIHKLLHQTIPKHLLLSANEWISVLLDIAEALFHVHIKGFLHCDVKSNNVLVTGKKGFLIDFGKACLISRPKARKYTSFYNHIATEVLRGQPVSTSSDVFFVWGNHIYHWKEIAKRLSGILRKALQRCQASVETNYGRSNENLEGKCTMKAVILPAPAPIYTNCRN